MNAKIILGLVWVVLLSSSSLSADRYSYNGYENRSYTKHGSIRDRYTTQELRDELRRQERRDIRKQERRQDRRELRRLKRKEAKRQARREDRRELRRLREQEDRRYSCNEPRYTKPKRHSIHIKNIFKLPPPPFFSKF